jgi:hypothetical protein
MCLLHVLGGPAGLVVRHQLGDAAGTESILGSLPMARWP